MKLSGIFRPILSESGPVAITPTVFSAPPAAKAVAARTGEKPTSLAKGIQCTAMTVTVKPQVKKLDKRRTNGFLWRHCTQGRS